MELIKKTHCDKILGISRRLASNTSIYKNSIRVGISYNSSASKANWFLLNWWSNEDILHQKLYASPVDNFNTIKQVEDQSLIACVYEIDIYAFESEARKRQVLIGGNPDFNGYLEARLG